MADRTSGKKISPSVMMMAIFALIGIVLLLVGYEERSRSMLYVGLAVTVVAVVEGIILLIVQERSERRKCSPRKS
jgi:Na+/H+ antiporter NhaD/arsenite permease-like protein